MTRSTVRLAAKISAVSLAAAAVLTAGSIAWLQTLVPPQSGTYALPGLTSTVAVSRDRHGIPYVSARTEEDAYFALGFVHAQDRLWQMEWHRRLALGRVAEIIGERGLSSDRLARLMGFGKLAEAALSYHSADVQRALQAYTAGVNGWMAQNKKLPLEFVLLGFEPEPWRPSDSLAIWRGMAAMLSHNARDELLVARAARRLSAPHFEALFPGATPGPLTLASAEVAEAFDGAHQVLRPSRSAGASNVWAISGSRTVSGKPILANDPHTPFGEPALWYLARLEAEGLHVAGATIPGLPNVVLGHNGRIAWGMTSNGFDVQDLFVDNVDTDNASHYRTPEGSRAFEISTETILVAGRAPEHVAIRRTRHGPVLSDIGPRAAAFVRTQPDSENVVVSLAYSGHFVADRTVEALFRINRAANWTDFVDAARLWSLPPQNLVMAAGDGTIGLISVGRVPLRNGSDGRIPRPGASGAFDWGNEVPFERMPLIANPATGLIVNANNLVSPQQSELFGDALDEPLRAERIEKLIAGTSKHTVQHSLSIQADAFATDTTALLPLLLAANPTDARARQAIDLLRGWNGEMDASRPEPLIYVAWLRELTRTLFAARLGDLFEDYWRIRPSVLGLLLRDRPDLCSPEQAGCGELLARTLQEAVDILSQRYGSSIERWEWGVAHAAAFRHPIFSEIPLLAPVIALATRVSGGPFAVNRSDPAFENDRAPYSSVFGAEFRAVYDLDDLARSRFVIATGQSGHLLSRNRNDLTQLWRIGQAVEIDFSVAPGRVSEVTILQPK